MSGEMLALMVPVLLIVIVAAYSSGVSHGRRDSDRLLEGERAKNVAELLEYKWLFERVAEDCRGFQRDIDAAHKAYRELEARLPRGTA